MKRCRECGRPYEVHSNEAEDQKLMKPGERAAGERCPTSPDVSSGPYWTDGSIWSIPMKGGVQVKEPELCTNCGSDAPMDYLQVSVNCDDNRWAWVCSECGHAHLVPHDHADDERRDQQGR